MRALLRHLRRTLSSFKSILGYISAVAMIIDAAFNAYVIWKYPEIANQQRKVSARAAAAAAAAACSSSEYPRPVATPANTVVCAVGARGSRRCRCCALLACTANRLAHSAMLTLTRWTLVRAGRCAAAALL
jgi:hypothetical protein